MASVRRTVKVVARSAAVAAAGVVSVGQRRRGVGRAEVRLRAATAAVANVARDGGDSVATGGRRGRGSSAAVHLVWKGRTLSVTTLVTTRTT